MRIIFTIIFALLIIVTYSFGYKLNHLEGELAGRAILTGEIHGGNQVIGTVPEPEKTVQPQAIFNSENSIDPNAFVSYAKTFTGVPYVYGSTNPAVGFDCSGFINHVSKHFGLKVPRSSVDFTNIGETISIEKAKPGDFILFTGTDKTRRVVGHIGIITDNSSEKLSFIHSTSGKAKGVTESEFSQHYQERFMKVIRLIDQA